MGVQELAVVGLVGSGVGAALGLPMVWPRRDRALDPRVLGGAMLLMSAIAALISARLGGFVPTSAAVDHAINFFGLAAFPLAVVYTRLASGAPRVWWARAPAMWLPAAAYAAALLARGALGLDTGVPFLWLLPVAVTFTAMSASALWHRRADAATTLVPPEWVVGFQVVLNVAQIVRMDFGHIPVVRALVPLVLAATFVSMVAWVAWRTVAAWGAPVAEALPDRKLDAPVSTAPARYERSSLDERAAADLLARVERALADGRLFARADLTLAYLAGAAGATAHQVSEALNRYRGVTFHELVNRARVDDVKVQLADPRSDRYTIEGMGLSAGFGSRSALYAAFRRFEGMTPTAFRAMRRDARPG